MTATVPQCWSTGALPRPPPYWPRRIQGGQLTNRRVARARWAPQPSGLHGVVRWLVAIVSSCRETAAGRTFPSYSAPGCKSPRRHALVLDGRGACAVRETAGRRQVGGAAQRALRDPAGGAARRGRRGRLVAHRTAPSRNRPLPSHALGLAKHRPQRAPVPRLRSVTIDDSQLQPEPSGGELTRIGMARCHQNPEVVLTRIRGSQLLASYQEEPLDVANRPVVPCAIAAPLFHGRQPSRRRKPSSLPGIGSRREGCGATRLPPERENQCR